MQLAPAIPLQKCPNCGKDAMITKLPHSDGSVSYSVHCVSDDCRIGFGSTNEAACARWNRLRAPRITLRGDELGADIPDAAARQQVLDRVKPYALPLLSFIGGFPISRIQRHLDELVASGEVVREQMKGGIVYRLVPDPQQGGLMARKPLALQTAQIPLIEVEHPMTKKFKALRRQYESLIADKNTASQKAKDVRNSIIELIKENGIKADSDGVIKFVLDGGLITITPGDAKLNIREAPAEKPQEEDDEDAEDGDK